MGVLKYDGRMNVRTASIRMTQAQANSLTAMAHAMSLTVSDVIRFAVDELVEDIPEPRLFTRHVRLSLHPNSPTWYR